MADSYRVRFVNQHEAAQTNPDGVWADHLSIPTGTTLPAVTCEAGSDTPVLHFNQTWRVGSFTSGLGVEVGGKFIEFYRGFAVAF